jgi:predicted ATP-grasp superfamily ATP-dependent carboligase
MKSIVLVFPCGSEIGLEIHNSLKWSSHIELWGGSSVDDHGKYVYKNYIGNMPYIDNDNFIDQLNEIIIRHKFDFIFPAHDSVVLKLAENSKLLRCKVIGSLLETCQVCRSKRQTYDKLSSILRVPKLYRVVDSDISYPVFLKPDIGQGGKGTYLAKTKHDLDFYLSKDPTLIILENLPGKEFTIDCFTDRKAKLRFVGARERSRIKDGISVNTKNVKDKKFIELAEKINGIIKLRGAWFFQIKESRKKELVLMEVAPRIAGSMGIYRNLGVNFALLSIYDAMDLDIEIDINKYPIEMDRALVNRFSLNFSYKHVYIDLDDTIVLKNKVNPIVMQFLYQCLNNDIKLHLVTRHYSRFNEDTEVALRKYRIKQIFESIINIPKGEKKSDYIKEIAAIFIDDSFSERLDVSKKLEIPVFEVSSLESLINWKY